MKQLTTLLSLLIISASPLQAQEHTEYKDLVYTSGKQLEDSSLQALNLVVPTVNRPPLLIWIGGGAWSYGDRHVEMDLARKFADEGIAVAVPGHRLSSAVWKDPSFVSENQHPDHINDIAAAVAWLVRNAETYGYSSDELFIGGYSSGAHLAALLCLDPEYLKKYNLEPRIFSGVIPVAGTYDIAQYHEAFLTGERKELAKLHVEAVFGDNNDAWIAASPTTFAQNHRVPMLLISESGTYEYTLIFEEKLTGNEGFEVIHYRDFTHSGLWKDISRAAESDCRRSMLNFIFNNSKTIMMD